MKGRKKMSDQETRCPETERQLRELVSAANAYMLAQNSGGFKDRGAGASAARTELCGVLYTLNEQGYGDEPGDPAPVPLPAGECPSCLGEGTVEVPSMLEGGEVDCPECGGEGSIADPGPQAVWPETDPEECSECEGTGKVEGDASAPAVVHTESGEDDCESCCGSGRDPRSGVVDRAALSVKGDD